MHLAELRYAIRSLARSPALATALLLSVALGIGSHASVFGFVGGVLVRSGTPREADRLVAICRRDAHGEFEASSPTDFAMLRALTTPFASVVAMEDEARVNVSVGDRTRWLVASRITPDFFDTIALDPAAGRLAPGESDSPPHVHDVVISHALWQDEFRQLEAIGSTLVVDGARSRIVGVAPAWFDGLYMGRPIDLWMPLDVTGAGANGGQTLSVMARLQPGVGIGVARTAIAAATAGDVTPQRASTIDVVSYSPIEPSARMRLDRIHSLLVYAAALVFLVAAANVAGLLLSRASARAHEMSVRVALGVTRRQMVAQLLADSVVVSAGGGLLGALLSFWTAQLFPALLFAEDAAQLDFSPDLRGLITASVVGILMVIACGMAPLSRVRLATPALVLRRDNGGFSDSARRLRAGLVVVQMALCCLLLVSAGIVFHGTGNALQTDHARRVGPLIIGSTDGAGAFFEDALASVRKVPQVVDAAWVRIAPGNSAPQERFRVEPPNATPQRLELETTVFAANRFEPARLKPVAGRPFSGGDGPFACRVALVNQATATRYFAGDALGRVIEEPGGVRAEVIGVIGPEAARAHDPAVLRAYYYVSQTPDESMSGPRVFFARSAPAVRRDASLDVNVVSASYFGLVQAATVAGRLFTDADALSACGGVVVNAEAADRYFGGDAVGGAVVSADGQRAEIIGVVRAGQFRAMQPRPRPTVYYLMAQHSSRRMTLVVRTRDDASQVVMAIERRVGSVAGGGLVAPMMTLDAQMRRTSMAADRITLAIVTVCAAIALVLSLVGVYGVMADSVTRRTREFALRAALGARSWALTATVLVEGLRLAAIGAAAGVVAALLYARFSSALPGAGWPPIWILAGSPFLLLVIVAVASIIPSRRAMRVDPNVALREA